MWTKRPRERPDEDFGAAAIAGVDCVVRQADTVERCRAGWRHAADGVAGVDVFEVQLHVDGAKSSW